MFTARTKIHKSKKTPPTPIEENVAQALFDMESSNASLKAELKGIVIAKAKVVTVGPSKSAVVIWIPYKLLPSVHRIQPRLVRELEKKLSKPVVIVGQRRILPKPTKKNRISAQKRPRSRTLTAVHDAILEDLVYPTEVVGKRIRYRLDGTRFFKVYLDQRVAEEAKFDTFSAVYKTLTGKEVVFELPVE
jgi:small subunit ribosomal protein S7e